MSRKILVTTALPYANGPLHLGHCVEHIQTDIWVRTHKMLGLDCIAICGEDAHGTPIMLKAEALRLSPEDLIAQTKKSHEADFKAFSVHYDGYHTTHSKENQDILETIFAALVKRGDIIKKTITQAYDPVQKMFLPDRYVKGTCPFCKALNQYGDNCEVCGATYTPADLIDPISVVSGSKPIKKDSEHYFFNLPLYENFLKDYVHQGHLQEEMANKLEEWLAGGLKPWDISRDAPYFGFPIPGEKDKYFYVWLDATIGYLSSFKKYCQEKGLSFESYWAPDSTAEVYHFVGKDIVYFHALFWPAVLKGAGFRPPTAIYSHGFLTVNGQKMSKSRGTFIEAKTYADHLDPEYLRYYFAAKLNARVEDLDLQFDDFSNRINADLVGKVVNIASRSAAFIAKYFNHQLSQHLAEPALYQELLEAKDSIIQGYLQRNYAESIRRIMVLADKVNQYIDQKKPWVLAKNEGTLAEVQAISTLSLNLFRVLMTYLKPVLPEMAAKAERFLNCPPLMFSDMNNPLINQSINDFEPLMQRVDKHKIEALLEASKNK